MADIERLQKRVADLYAQLRDAEAELMEAKLAACPVKIGDIVASTRTGVKHRVTEVDVRFRKTWVIGNPLKKDGTFGAAKRYLYDNFTVERE